MISKKRNKFFLFSLYMNKERIREILKTIRDFLLCCKKTVDVIEEVVEEVEIKN